MKEFDVYSLHPEIAAQANFLISHYRLDDVTEKSAGAGTFYNWVILHLGVSAGDLICKIL